MAILINRAYFGNYPTSRSILLDKKVAILQQVKPIITVLTENQGFGQIKGTTKKIGENYSPVPVCVFRRDNRQLLWETLSKPDGTYRFGNISKDLECFVVAFDPNNQYNAVIQDNVVPK